jgi:hypothetical protein
MDLFVRPLVQDLVAVKEILGVFGEASRLWVDYRKSLVIMIRGELEDEMTSKHQILGIAVIH